MNENNKKDKHGFRGGSVRKVKKYKEILEEEETNEILDEVLHGKIEAPDSENQENNS